MAATMEEKQRGSELEGPLHETVLADYVQPDFIKRCKV